VFGQPLAATSTEGATVAPLLPMPNVVNESPSVLIQFWNVLGKEGNHGCRTD